MEKEFVVKFSVFKYRRRIFWFTVLSFLVFPLFLVVICTIIRSKVEKLVFNGLYYEYHAGFLKKKVVECKITDIQTITVEKSLFGKIFNYGNVKYSTSNRTGRTFDHVKMPDKLKEYLHEQGRNCVPSVQTTVNKNSNVDIL